MFAKCIIHVLYICILRVYAYCHCHCRVCVCVCVVLVIWQYVHVMVGWCFLFLFSFADHFWQQIVSALGCIASALMSLKWLLVLAINEFYFCPFFSMKQPITLFHKPVPEILIILNKFSSSFYSSPLLPLLSAPSPPYYSNVHFSSLIFKIVTCTVPIS